MYLLKSLCVIIISFFIRHLPVLLAIVIFSIFGDFTFWKLFLFLWLVSAFYDAIVWQFPACIEINKPIPSQRNGYELRIMSGNISVKERFNYFLSKLRHCLTDWKVIIATLFISCIFTFGYIIITK